MSLPDIDNLPEALSALSDAQKLELIEHLARSMRKNGKPEAAQKRDALNALRRELASLPSGNPADGLSNRDHDRLLYGGDA